MAEIILFAERQIDGFANNQGYGVPSRGFNFGEDIEAFVLEPDAEYTVLWDGEAYKTIAQDVSAALGDGTYALGNAAALDSSFSGNNEPFIIGWSTVGIAILVVDGSTETTHTVGIVQEIEQEEQPETQYGPNDAVILSYSQTPVVYEKIPKVWLTHPDSTEEDPVLVPFTYGEAVSKTVEPDFSGGDMAVEVPEGELVTELTVKKPEELTPENIPEGMYIAGVGPGAFKGGSEEVEKTVELDFSAGDMEVTPEAGKAFSKVTIPVPANLIPGNIAEGVNIANVIGTLVTGGGGGDISITTTTYLGTSTTITHGHGVVPDLLLIFPKAGNQYTFVGSNYKSKFMGLVYVSPELAAKLGLSSWCIKEIYTNYQGILVYKPYESYTVTEKTVTLVNTPPNAVSFEVLAISGLT